MEKKLFKYLDGQLDREEIFLFENELKSFPKLLEEQKFAETVLKEIRELQPVADLNDYLAGARARFHSNNSSRKEKPKFYGFAFAGSGIFTLVFMIMFGLSSNHFLSILNHEEQVAEVSSDYENNSIGTDEVSSLENIVGEDKNTTEAIENKYDEFVAIQPDNLNSIMNDYNISPDELIASMAPEQIDLLINKKLGQ